MYILSLGKQHKCSRDLNHLFPHLVLNFGSHCIIAAVLSGAYPSSLRPSVPVRTAAHFSYVSHLAAPVISASQNNSRDGTDWLTFHLYMLMKPVQCVCGMAAVTPGGAGPVGG